MSPRELIPFYRVVIEFRKGDRVFRRKFYFLDEQEQARFIADCEKLGGKALYVSQGNITTPDRALAYIKDRLFKKPQEGGATEKETAHDPA